MAEIEELSSLILRPGENYVRLWQGNIETRKQASLHPRHLGYQLGYTEMTQKNYENGALVLTNRRLIWVSKHGFVRKRFEFVFDVDLNDVRGLAIGGLLFKHISLGHSNGVHKLHLKLGKGGFKLLKQMVEYQRSGGA